MRLPTSYRSLFFALFALAGVIFLPIASAIEGDQVIDPDRAVPAEAESTSDEPMRGIFSGESASMGAMVTFVGYAIIIAAVAIVVWYLFKRGVIRQPFNKGEGRLKISETRMLGNRQFIMVVEYEDQKLLLGVGPGKIDYLTNLRSYSEKFPEVDGGAMPAAKGEQS